MTLDFTFKKYEELCNSLKKYDIYSVGDYLSKKPKNNLIILRHDVDRNILNALKMALLENNLGIKSSYYFRYNKNVFKKDIIKKIYLLDHEIGYHYEVLSKAKGDYDLALQIFKHELSEFRAICDINTVCMHGRPLSKVNNVDIWKKYSLNNFQLVGEALLSIKNINYYSDTGRNWTSQNNLRDRIINNNQIKKSIKTTDDLMELLEKYPRQYYLNIHPERWASGSFSWAQSYFIDILANQGKKLLKKTYVKS